MSHHIPRYSVHAPHRLPQPRHVGMGHFLDWLKFGWQMFSKNPGVWVVQAILMIVGYWFDQRNTASAEPMKDVPYGADALLRMNRRMYC